MQDDPVKNSLRAMGLISSPQPVRDQTVANSLRQLGIQVQEDDPTARAIERMVREPLPSQLETLSSSRSPVQELGFEDGASFLEKTGRLVKRLGKAAVDSVNVFEEGISGKQRLGRALTIGSFFVPLGLTARLAGAGAKLGTRMLLTGAQEAAIGATISALNDDSPTAGALFSGGVGATLEAIATRGRSKLMRAATRPAVEAFDDATRFADPSATPFHTQDFALLTSVRRGQPAALNAQRYAQAHDELVRRGYTPIAAKGYDPTDLTTGFKPSEDSFLVPGMKDKDALEIARRFGQEYVITRNGLFDLRNNRVQPLDPKRTRFNAAVSPTDDYFTEVTVGGKKQFVSLGFADDWERLGDAPVPLTTADEKVQSLIAPTKGRLEQLRDKFRAVPWKYRMHQWYNEMIDSTEGFRMLDEATGEAPQGVLESVQKLARMMRGWGSTAEHNLKYGLVKFGDQSQIIRRGLFEILEDVAPEEFEAFTRYGFARRWKAIAATGKQLPKLRDGKRLTETDLDEIIANAPQHFSKVFDEIVDWRNTLLKEYLGNSGILTPKAVNAILTSEDYVPLRRALDELVSRTNLDAADHAFAIFDPVKKLGQLGDSYENWIEMLMKESLVFTKLAHEQRVIDRMVDVLESFDPEYAAQFAVKRKLPPQKLSKAKQEVIAAIKDSDPALAEAVETLDEELLAILAPHKFMGEKPIIGALRDGKRVWYEVTDPILWRSVRDMRPAELNWMEKILTATSAPARTLRAGATLSLEFMARNPMRDLMGAFITAGANPLDFLRGVASALKADEWYKQWVAAGGPRSALVSQDRAVLRQNFQQWMERHRGLGPKLLSVVRHPLDALRALSEAMETGTRLGHFKRELPRLVNEGWDMQNALLEAAFRSRDRVGPDFAVHGARTAALRTADAFWNAMLQGWRWTAEAFKREPKAAVARATATVTVPSILFYFANTRGDEQTRNEYFDLPQWERAVFWHTKIGDTWVRIPKPFDIGMFFGTTVENMLEAIDRESPEILDAAWKDTMFDYARDLAPIPTAVQPIAERIANYKLFQQRPVVPASELDIEPAFRATPGTSELSKWLVNALGLDALGLDPITLDHITFSYTGGLGRLLYGDVPDYVISTLEGTGTPPIKATRAPLIKGFVSRFPEDSEASRRFYDFANEVRRASATAAKLEKEMRLDDLEDFLDARLNVVELSNEVQKVMSELSNLRREREAIRNDTQMDPRSKQELLDEITELEYQLIRDANALQELAVMP